MTTALPADSGNCRDSHRCEHGLLLAKPLPPARATPAATASRLVLTIRERSVRNHEMERHIGAPIFAPPAWKTATWNSSRDSSGAERYVTMQAVLMRDALTDYPAGPLVVPAREPCGVRLSLVIPTYNEAKNLAALLCRLDELLRPALGDSFELIVVDDDSPDRTWELALSLAERYPALRVVRRQAERGLGTAVVRGWQVARGEVLGVMDGDLQHPPEVNLVLLQEISRGADLAAASRNVVGGGVSDWSAARRVLSRGAQLLGLALLPSVLGRLSDPMSGYFMVRRTALEKVLLDPLGYKILIEVVARCRVRWIAETPYVFRERTEGESKVTWHLYAQYLAHLLRLRWATLPNSVAFRYGVVGVGGVVIDMSLLFALSDPGAMDWGLTRSKLLAAQPALLWNFLLHDRWTFGELARSEGYGIHARRRWLSFYVVCSIGLLAAVVLLNMLFNIGGLDRYLANGIAILTVASWNYWLSRKLIWAPMPTTPEGEAPRQGRLSVRPRSLHRTAARHALPVPARGRTGAGED